MTAGLSVTFADGFLNVYRGISLSGLTAVYVQLHTGDPGAGGTNNVSAVTTRNQITWNPPVNGSMTLLNLGHFLGVATETISHVSLWNAASSGIFQESGQLSQSIRIVSGTDIFFSVFTKTFSPLAA